MKDSSKTSVKRRTREQAAARADALVKLEYQSGLLASRSQLAGSAATAQPSPGGMRGKHRRKFGAPRRCD